MKKQGFYMTPVVGQLVRKPWSKSCRVATDLDRYMVEGSSYYSDQKYLEKPMKMIKLPENICNIVDTRQAFCSTIGSKTGYLPD
ncbi:hypothetical protein CI610_00234 [invertebrate metagenome]|uniref:Uncharacterized protein n=1 Tax=invertebrate metagenome TaxID=1711999 RepID=A0A2H9TBX6_9ZZZZ